MVTVIKMLAVQDFSKKIVTPFTPLPACGNARRVYTRKSYSYCTSILIPTQVQSE